MSKAEREAHDKRWRGDNPSFLRDYVKQPKRQPLPKTHPYYTSDEYKAQREEDMRKHREANKRYRDRNRETLRERQRTERETHPFRGMLYRVRHRAKKKGIPYDLDTEHLNQLWDECKGTCPMTGTPMIKGAHEYTPHAVSIDRLDHTKGYTKDNIRLISVWYNTARWHNTDQQTLETCKHVVNANTQ